MKKNVVDLEATSLRVAALHEHGLTVLVDFAAAFPSVSHQYMTMCLKAFGVPASVIRVLAAFYLDGHCRISIGGTHWPGFSMTSGIRQGCPLSPLMFAVVFDALLRRLASHLPGHQVHKVFADDVGIVLEDVGKQLDAMVSILDAFGTI